MQMQKKKNKENPRFYSKTVNGVAKGDEERGEHKCETSQIRGRQLMT